jgi:hypothetical protein
MEGGYPTFCLCKLSCKRFRSEGSSDYLDPPRNPYTGDNGVCNSSLGVAEVQKSFPVSVRLCARYSAMDLCQYF